MIRFLFSLLLLLQASHGLTCDTLTQEIWSAADQGKEKHLIFSCACRMCYDETTFLLSDAIENAADIGIIWHQGDISNKKASDIDLDELLPCPNLDNIEGPISPTDVSEIAQVFWDEIGQPQHAEKTYCHTPLSAQN